MFEAKIRINNQYILKDLLWGQGLRNLNYICDEGLGEDLMFHIEDVFGDEVHDVYEINDYIANKLDVNLFISTHTLLNDLWTINELMEYTKQLDYPEAHDKIEEFIASGNAEGLWNYLKYNFSNYSLNKVFSEVVDLEDITEQNCNF